MQIKKVARTSRPTVFLVALTLTAALAPMTAPAHAATPPTDVLYPFPSAQVTLSDGLWKTEREADRKYLHDLDADRLLLNFRVNAGLPTGGAPPLGGWEAPSCELRGHFVGHYLSAVALMYAATGDTALKAKGDSMVAELAKCQAKIGTGYLSAFPTEYFDRLEAGKQVWAPYYTIHKIMAGMVDMYTLTGNKQALTVAEGMADYFKARNDKITDDGMKIVMRNEFGGMANVLYDLYAINHRPADLALAHRFDQHAFLDPLMHDVDDLTGIHANTHIPKILGAARRYELVGDPEYREATAYFWDRIANHRSYATGGSNKGEGWGEPDRLAGSLVPNNQETCTTYNMLKVTRDLIRWTGDPKYADFYERAFYNGILPAQNPKNGMMIYYLPLAAGNHKNWGTPNNDFWCCYGTGVEQFAKLNDSIYFHDKDNGLYVNLYTASSVTWPAKGLRVEQQTRFPNADTSAFLVHAARPTTMALHLHIPYWAKGASLSVNGKNLRTAAAPSTYAVINRTWKEGDRVDVTLPMTLRAEPMPDDPNMKAMMYGPIALAGEITSETKMTPGAKTTGLLRETAPDPAAYLKPVGGQPLTFETTGQAQNLRFVPLYDIIDQPFGVYWTMLTPGSAREKEIDARIGAETAAKQAYEARVIDRVIPNNPASEKAHHLIADRSSSGKFGGGAYRDGQGSFQWDLKTLPGVPAILACTYWGSDGGRTFDIIVNGQKIATQTLNNDKPGQMFTVEYPIPAGLDANNTVTVKFVAHDGSIVGGVFGAATLKPAPVEARQARR
jgi:DUF1680 family protein